MHVRTLNKEGQLCLEGGTGGCESWQSLQEQGPPRLQLLLSPKELWPQPHEAALTGIWGCSQKRGGACRAQLGAAKLQDGMTGVSQLQVNVPSWQWKALESLCVCSFPDFSPCNFALSLTFGIPRPSESSACHRQQTPLCANMRRREKGAAPALCPISTQAGV